jgi:hypothetical protein
MEEGRNDCFVKILSKNVEFEHCIINGSNIEVNSRYLKAGDILVEAEKGFVTLNYVDFY